MTKRAAAVAVIAALVGAAATAAAFTFSLRERDEVDGDRTIGKYQLHESESGFFLVDTSTGETFRRDEEGIWVFFAAERERSDRIEVVRSKSAMEARANAPKRLIKIDTPPGQPERYRLVPDVGRPPPGSGAADVRE